MATSTKHERISRILANSCYMPQSGMYKQVAAALGKLSNDAIAGLEIITALRCGDAAKGLEAKPAKRKPAKRRQ